jgi:hypothetical protein
MSISRPNGVHKVSKVEGYSGITERQARVIPTVPLSYVGLGHAVGYSTLDASRQACDVRRG